VAEPRGLLAVDSQPAGLRVEVGGEILGRTPLRVRLRSGRLIRVCVLPDDEATHRSAARAVILRPREERSIQLSPQPLQVEEGTRRWVRPAWLRVRCGEESHVVRLHLPGGICSEHTTPTEWIEVPAQRAIRLDVLPPEEDGWIGICRQVILTPGGRCSFDDLRPLRREGQREVPRQDPRQEAPRQEERPSAPSVVRAFQDALRGPIFGAFLERWGGLEARSRALRMVSGALPKEYLRRWSELEGCCGEATRWRDEICADACDVRPEAWVRARRRAGIEISLTPFLRLAQFIDEALPVEVPDAESVEIGREERGDVAQVVLSIAEIFGCDYEHIPLYRRTRSDFDYRSNILCQPFSAALGGAEVAPGVVCRVSVPLLIPRAGEVGDVAVVHVRR